MILSLETLCNFAFTWEKAVRNKSRIVLRDGATIHVPMGSCDFSPCMFSLVDKFGVFWCVFV